MSGFACIFSLNAWQLDMPLFARKSCLGVPFGSVMSVPMTRESQFGALAFNQQDRKILGFAASRQMAAQLDEPLEAGRAERRAAQRRRGILPSRGRGRAAFADAGCGFLYGNCCF